MSEITIAPQQTAEQRLSELLAALMTPTNDGFLTITWGKGRAGCCVAASGKAGDCGGATSIEGAMVGAIALMKRASRG